MLDLIKEGIKLNQSLAVLPLKVVRKIFGEKNTNANQVMDAAEELVGMPFAAAARAVDNTCKSCPKNNGNETESAKKQCGPTVKNIWVNPEVLVFSDVEVKAGVRRAILTVHGLLCGG